MKENDKRYYLDTNILVFILLSEDMSGNIDKNTAKILDDNECSFYTSPIAFKIPLISTDLKFEYYINQGLQLIINKR